MPNKEVQVITKATDDSAGRKFEISRSSSMGSGRSNDCA
jgi:hypothetical protein